ncbi:MAG: hypothetical protein JRF53_07645 [Deltaproteobacteria bacterium]|nr:hypothetical protein [Deltaproteobacteria bacterium]MBW2343879.1 hypothetical protein [Deltaproteobacteria bacterium]
MKCPKCGYVSFDFNQICPKCNKDIAGERKKMSLPSFRPSPPSLLGALTGETSDSNIGLSVDGSGAFAAMGGETPFSPEDSQTIEAMEEAFEDSQSLEMQIEATPEEGIHFPTEEGGEELSADLEDLIIDTSDTPAIETEQASEDDAVSLDFDDLSGDETEIAFDEDISAGGKEGDDLSLDLESLELDSEPETASLDLDESSGKETLIALDEDITEAGEDELPIEFENLDSDDAVDAGEAKDEIDSVDLEDLELDLELEEPDGKPS